MSKPVIVSVSFYRDGNNLSGVGSFLCPGCNGAIRIAARWPGFPSLDCALRIHYDVCAGAKALPETLLFFVNDTSGSALSTGLVIIELNTPANTYGSKVAATTSDRDLYMHIARRAIFAASSRKEVYEVLPGDFDDEHEGIALCFKFTDSTEFTIYETPGDTTESLLCKAFRRLLRPPTRHAISRSAA